MKKCNFEDCVCPILFTDAVEWFSLTDKEIQSFCNNGCSPICGRELREYLEKRDRQRRRIKEEVIPLQINKNILSQYSDLQQEEKNLVRRIQSLNAQLSNMEVKGYMVADSVSCGKRGKKPLGSRKIQGFPYPEYDRKKEQLKTYKMQLELAAEKLLQMLTQVEEYIESIEDSRIRRIMRHRYIDNLNWTQVAINMGKNHTADSCRVAHDRFLQNL